MFKKTCFECGSKVDKIYDGLCEICFKHINPPIKEIKQLNIKYCNGCKRLIYNNQMYEREELEARIEEIVSKNLIINEHYQLQKIKIKKFNIEKATVSFDIEVDCKLKKDIEQEEED